MKSFKRTLCVMLTLLMLAMPLMAQAEERSFTCYGDDLNSEQYVKVLELLGADPANDVMIAVTHEDEVALLAGAVDAALLGSRSLSSARVTLTDEQVGISVTTHNINWVTPNMYASALVTAGVENARIVVAAPFEVSGTAALAGILKAYESASGQPIDSLAKSVAGSEIMLTGELSEAIGSQQAVELLAMVKQAIADYDLDDYDTLRPYVEEGAYQLGVQLTDAQIDSITQLGVDFAQLDFDPTELAAKLEGLAGDLQRIQKQTEELSGLLEKAVAWLRKVVDWLKALLGR